MFSNLFTPSEHSLMRIRGLRMGTDTARVHWYPWLMLVWSIWIFITPMYQAKYFPNWLWPTLVSYAVFLVLFHRMHYRDRRRVFACAMAVAFLGFAVTPFNPGAQGYLVYACAYLAFTAPPARALTWMVGILALYAVEWVWLGYPVIYVGTAIAIGIVVGLMNISGMQKALADAALSLSHDEVRRLAALAERERIGRDLHDLLGHTLSLVALKTDLAAKLLARGDDPAMRDAARREIAEVSRVARDALAQVRAAVTGIRAAGIAAELVSARLLLECDGVAFVSEIEPHALDTPDALPPTIETALALALREAVTNIQRHARARRATVGFQLRDGEARMTIVDDGRGGAITPGNGLEGMRERIEAVGGRLRVESHPGAGTRLEIVVPRSARGSREIDTELAA